MIKIPKILPEKFSFFEGYIKTVRGKRPFHEQEGRGEKKRAKGDGKKRALRIKEIS